MVTPSTIGNFGRVSKSRKRFPNLSQIIKVDSLLRFRDLLQSVVKRRGDRLVKDVLDFSVQDR